MSNKIETSELLCWLPVVVYVTGSGSDLRTPYDQGYTLIHVQIERLLVFYDNVILSKE